MISEAAFSFTCDVNRNKRYYGQIILNYFSSSTHDFVTVNYTLANVLKTDLSFFLTLRSHEIEAWASAVHPCGSWINFIIKVLRERNPSSRLTGQPNWSEDNYVCRSVVLCHLLVWLKHFLSFLVFQGDFSPLIWIFFPAVSNNINPNATGLLL